MFTSMDIGHLNIFIVNLYSMCFIKINFIIIKVISIKANKNILPIHIFPQSRAKSGRREV